jgi:hypothetical protein
MGAVRPEREIPRTRKKDEANNGHKSIDKISHPLGSTAGRRPTLRGIVSSAGCRILPAAPHLGRILKNWRKDCASSIKLEARSI